MRFMVLVKANKDSEAGVMPSDAMLTTMGRYNEELAKAGVMLDGAGLHPSSRAKRVRFEAGAAPRVIDGPFTETKELVSGYWLLQCKSWEEVTEWIKRAPFGLGPDTDVEIRQLFELSDFDMSETAQAVHDSVVAELAARQG